jgi:hypothetical protein
MEKCFLHLAAVAALSVSAKGSAGLRTAVDDETGERFSREG